MIFSAPGTVFFRRFRAFAFPLAACFLLLSPERRITLPCTPISKERENSPRRAGMLHPPFSARAAASARRSGSGRRHRAHDILYKTVYRKTVQMLYFSCRKEEPL